MTPTELETLAKTIEIVGKLVGTIGFPVVVSMYLLLLLPKHLEKVAATAAASQAVLATAIAGLKSDIQEMLKLLEYEQKFRDYTPWRKRFGQAAEKEDSGG